jgi:cobyric acid synthase
MQQFNIFIIHCFKDDTNALENVIANIKESSAIIIISHDPKATQSLSVEKQFSKRVTAELKITSVEKL